MAVKDIIMLKQKELKRLHVIHQVLEKQITQSKAAEVTGLSERQIRRIVQRIREEGDKKQRNKEKRKTKKTKKRDGSIYWHGHIGHFYQKRYKSILISKDDYLLACGSYIELNPVKARTADDPKDCKWSSYNAYAYGKKDPSRR